MPQYQTVRCHKADLERECRNAGEDGWRRGTVEKDLDDELYVLVEFIKD